MSAIRDLWFIFWHFCSTFESLPFHTVTYDRDGALVLTTTEDPWCAFCGCTRSQHPVKSRAEWRGYKAAILITHGQPLPPNW